ncbi:hypothetical protein RSSM_01944 [Rhodopirellula sallentina SM41]|uniref:Uncharacterized protein n=1 Tax=Rhodopirellula sallentina SM41 TaxID=1263870 RepID=M5UFI3_9BACT|nr:hypothetical protein RSSM_01944 [Rhodopirellula sallentina SM41]
MAKRNESRALHTQTAKGQIDVVHVAAAPTGRFDFVQSESNIRLSQNALTRDSGSASELKPS